MTELRELAFYYPNPVWSYPSWIKSLVLFFDGVALLVPSYMRDRPEILDPSTATGLREHGLLEIIEPETAVDKSATEKLASALVDIIASGVLDELAKEDTAFHEISMSRLGAYGDRELYEMVFEELKNRGLAKDSEDNFSIPMHPKVRMLVLILLSQILRPYGNVIKANLNPATDLGQMVAALSEFLSQDARPSSGSVVQFDLNTVTVDLDLVPIDEVLDFRQQNLEAHKRYMLSVRRFALALSRMSEEERHVNFEHRQGELDDLANDLRNRARRSWKKPASFGLSLAGTALSAVTAPLVGAVNLIASLAGHEKASEADAGVYSYLFRAERQFRRY